MILVGSRCRDHLGLMKSIAEGVPASGFMLTVEHPKGAFLSCQDPHNQTLEGGCLDHSSSPLGLLPPVLPAGLGVSVTFAMPVLSSDTEVC